MYFAMDEIGLENAVAYDIAPFSHVFEDEHPGVEKHLHAFNTVVAKRIC